MIVMFWAGLGLNMQLTNVVPTAHVSTRSTVKQGRYQASHQGKVRRQGQNNADLLSQTATARIHDVSSLLLARGSDAQGGHPFLHWNYQNPEALAIIEKLTARVDKADVPRKGVICKATL